MSDSKLIQLVADVWLENGGDAEGLLWTWKRIHEELQSREALASQPDTDGRDG